MAPIQGLVGRAELVVGAADTADVVGSGDVPVLATPRLLALAEQATVEALRDHLEPGTTTVGTSVSLEHTAPSPIGAKVMVTARLAQADIRRLVFVIEARQAHGGVKSSVGTGRIERMVVDRERFLAKVKGEADTPGA